MARKLSVISNEIIAYKESRPELFGLSSNSATAIWKMWVFVISIAIYSHEIILDFFKEDIQETLRNQIPGTPLFYVDKAFEYQEDSELVIDPNGTQLIFDPINLSKRLISRAAYSEDVDGSGNPQLTLKLAKGDTDSLSKLDGPELIRVRKYFERIKFAGTKIEIISIRPDEIIPTISIYHNGSLSDDLMLSLVEKAINNFILNLSFDGVFYKQKFIDAIQEIRGVSDVKVTQIDIRSYLDELNPVTATIDRKIDVESGYLKLSSELNESLSDVVTLVVE